MYFVLQCKFVDPMCMPTHPAQAPIYRINEHNQRLHRILSGILLDWGELVNCQLLEMDVGAHLQTALGFLHLGKCAVDFRRQHVEFGVEFGVQLVEFGVQLVESGFNFGP